MRAEQSDGIALWGGAEEQQRKDSRVKRCKGTAKKGYAWIFKAMDMKRTAKQSVELQSDGNAKLSMAYRITKNQS